MQTSTVTAILLGALYIPGSLLAVIYLWERFDPRKSRDATAAHEKGVAALAFILLAGCLLTCGFGLWLHFIGQPIHVTP
jgi:hypothetical protein